MHNRFAGDTLDILDRFCKAGIKMNFQLVLCPGINDGEELKKTLQDLALLHSCVDCIAVVPVGLTKYRDGLFPLVPYQQETAAAVIDIVEQFGKECMRKYGDVYKRQEQITFITTSELEQRYPELSRKQREHMATKEYGAVFLMQIGGALKDGEPHDGRAPDYDDWSLNGDILLDYPLLDTAFEVSSMESVWMPLP